MSAAQEFVDWIDEQGHPLSVVSREEMRQRNLLHPVTATFVFGTKGSLFVQRRSDTKDVYPGLFDLSVGGTVSHGESAVQNAYRETQEELGVRGVVLYWLFRHRYRDEVTNSLIDVFACIYDGPIRLQPEEVAGGAWMTEREAGDLVRAGQVCPDSSQAWALHQAAATRHGTLAERIARSTIPVAEFTA